MQFFGLVCLIITDNLNILLAFKHAINAKRYKEVIVMITQDLYYEIVIWLNLFIDCI